jgi:two-component system, chemotaxis family, CheB/CheR fusion protein
MNQNYTAPDKSSSMKTSDQTQGLSAYASAVVNTLRESVVILDSKLNVLFANQSFYTTFNTTVDLTVGRAFYLLGNKEWNVATLKNGLKRLLTKNSAFKDFELTQTFQHIGKKIFLVHGNKLILEDCENDLILLAIHDVTAIRTKAFELKLIEKAIQKKDFNENKIEKARLEKAVNERTRELTQVNKELIIQYIEKEKRAEELLVINKELSAFTYIASHDLQEPLRKTQLFISRILDEKDLQLNEKNKDYFRRIQVAANRMQVLINDLLAYSRITESAESFKKINLNEVLENVLQEPTLVQTIEATNTTVNFDKLPTVPGVAFQLEQLFTNLIINSIKYSSANRMPVIDIKCAIIKGTAVPDPKAIQNKKYYEISVTDNGIGFEQQYAEKIFMLFQRLHDKQTYSGTGIGLTICKKITENHHGYISASSLSDAGTTISIYLPVQ